MDPYATASDGNRPSPPGRPGTGRALLVLTLLAAALALIAMGVTADHLSERVVRNESRDRVDFSAHLASVGVSESVRRLTFAVTRFGNADPVRRAVAAGNPRRLDAFVRQLHGDDTFIRAALLTDSSGRLLAVSPAAARATSISIASRDWYRRVQDQSPYVSDIYEVVPPGSDESVSVVTVAHRARDARGREFLAAVVQQASDFGLILERLAGEADSEVTIMDGDGAVVATSGTAATTRRAAAARGRDDTVERDGHFLSAREVQGTSWSVVVERPVTVQDRVAGELRVVVWSIVAMALVGMIVLLMSLLRLAAAVRSARAMHRRHRQALEINDALVQRLAAANLARELGRDEQAAQLEREALVAGQELIAEMAQGMRLRRSRAAGDR